MTVKLALQTALLLIFWELHLNLVNSYFEPRVSTKRDRTSKQASCSTGGYQSDKCQDSNINLTKSCYSNVDQCNKSHDIMINTSAGIEFTEECHCDRSCFVYKDCCSMWNQECPDEYRRQQRQILRKYATHIALPPLKCKQVRLENYLTYKTNWFKLVSECPPEASSLEKEKCRMVNVISSITPVRNSRINVDYQNEYCAKCHGITEYTTWKSLVQCDSNKTILNWWDVVVMSLKNLEKKGCNVVYTPPRKGVRNCQIACNGLCTTDTNWTVTSQSTELPPDGPSRAPSKKPSIRKLYKSFQFIIKSVHNQHEISIRKKEDDKLIIHADSFMCSDFNLNKDQVDFCSSRLCEPGYVLWTSYQSFCERLVEALEVIVIINQSLLELTAGIVNSRFETLGDISNISIANETYGHSVFQTWIIQINNIHNKSSYKIDKEVEEIESSLQEMVGFGYDQYYEKLYIFADYHSEYHYPFYTEINKLKCLWMVYMPNNTNISENINSDNEKYLVVHNNKLYVQDYKCSSYDSEFVNTVLTLVFISISLVCLLIRIFLQFCISTYWTMPAKIQFIYVTTLFISQSVFVAAPYLQNFRKLCVFIGWVMHWSFLSVTVWTTIITLDIWLTFRPSQSIAFGTSLRTSTKLCIYSSIACVLPLLFVTAGIILDLDAVNMGYAWRPFYGQEMCYFNNQLPKVALFIVPLSLCLLINLTLTTIVSITLCCSSQRSAVKTSTRRHFSPAVHLRLIALSGSTWVTGIIAELTAYEPLWYVFTVLNVGQGLFIFLVFVCRRKVFRELIIRLRIKSEGSSPSNVPQSHAFRRQPQ